MPHNDNDTVTAVQIDEELYTRSAMNIQLCDI